jgi:hypothetical protein
MERATMSSAVPTANGTMIRIGLLGNVCALAGDAPIKAELIASKARRFEYFIFFPVGGA